MSERVDVELSSRVDSSPCKLQITFSDAGMVFFKCLTHSTWTETKYKETIELYKGTKEYEQTKFEGERLTLICRERIRAALKQFMETAKT